MKKEKRKKVILIHMEKQFFYGHNKFLQYFHNKLRCQPITIQNKVKLHWGHHNSQQII